MRKDDLARAVVGLPGFKWRSGVRFRDPRGRWHRLNGLDGHRWVVPGFIGCEYARSGDEVIDLDDAATGGVLLAMVPPNDRWRCAHRPVRGWVWFSDESGGWEDADSLGHAAAAVLVDCGRCV